MWCTTNFTESADHHFCITMPLFMFSTLLAGMDSTVRDWSASSRVRAARPEAPSCFTRSLSGLTHFSQMNQLHLIILVYLYSTVNGLRDGESREARLARRQQHPAYKRALSNLHLQFISEFLAEKPLVQPTTDSELWSFDPSGLGD